MMISTKLFLCLSLFFLFLPLVTPIRVSTSYGEIEGFEESYPNSSFTYKSVSKFLGIPFAAPPVGDLRMKPPIDPASWKEVRQAKQQGNICMQKKTFESAVRMFTQNFTYSEDCLYLDVYTPNVSQHLPVMVYIHGGAYEFGTSVTYPSDYLALQGVVVVVIQYRLGAFGFLTTGDTAAPGNYGMLDQVAALQWVKGNIKHFGGDPGKVTIFGLSAGGSSVSLHLLSPLSQGLFHRAIAESGVDLSPFAVQPTSLGLRYASELAKKLGCPSGDHSEMMACIRQKQAKEIQSASESIPYAYSENLAWAPVVDKNFLLDTPRNLRNKGEFKKANLMIVFASQEGGSSVGFLANMSFGMAQSVDNGVSPSFFKEFLTKYARYRDIGKQKSDLIRDALQFMYTPWPDSSDKYALRTQLADLIGDYYFVAPSHAVADIHSMYADVYMCMFDYQQKVRPLHKAWYGVQHGDNTLFDFGVPFMPRFAYLFPDQSDKDVSLFIMEMYTNFAKLGNPTPQPVSGVTFEKYNSSQRPYLRVDKKSEMTASFAPRRMSFWNDYHPKLMEVKFEKKTVVDSNAGCATSMAKFVLIAFPVFSMAFSWGRLYL